ncbi:SDR family oxidoreductase [uncultured Ruegeria sp.]|uniref:SDR family oxidoreductase n=1 Tax=uncultured Ruegeria sp. TaxID=259304 RepID=UPI0026084249|nr:SDR family oxidoreductase [uncultured Ruegeria sp.]
MPKVILITGTSTGLGVQIAVQAAQAGHTVYATMRNLAKRGILDVAASDAGVNFNVLELDVQDSASVNAAVDQIIANEDRIDTLINNAGAGFVRTTEQASEEDVAWVMDVNFMGVVRCTKAMMPHMRSARSGHVITISSVGGLVGQPFNEIYCAAKFAVEGYTEALASYVTPNFGIHFSTVEPGGIQSEFAANVLKHVEATGGIAICSDTCSR